MLYSFSIVGTDIIFPAFLLQLNDTIKAKELQINELSVKQKSEGDLEKLNSVEASRLKLESKEKVVEELKNKLQETKEKWSQALGNEQALQEAL